jgi:hypothetical protein
MPKKNIKIFLVLFFLALYLFFPLRFAHAAVDLSKPAFQGIVPCGTDENDKCTLCHLIIGIQRLVRYGLYLVTTATLVGIFIGGAMYLISAGNEELLKSAKSFISATLMGFGIVLGAWIIVNTIFWIIPRKSDYGIGKSTWFSIECSTVSSTTMPNANQPAPSDATVGNASNNNQAKQTCGASGKGKCFEGVSVVAVCPSGYSATIGDPINACPSGYNCCELNGTPISSVGRCGVNNVGECKSGVVACPSGWTATMGNPANPCASGSKCCVKNGESSETCRKPFSTVTGKCFYGMSSCPDNWDHPWFAVCSASQSICCVKK